MDQKTPFMVSFQNYRGRIIAEAPNGHFIYPAYPFKPEIGRPYLVLLEKRVSKTTGNPYYVAKPWDSSSPEMSSETEAIEEIHRLRTDKENLRRQIDELNSEKNRFQTLYEHAKKKVAEMPYVVSIPTKIPPWVLPSGSCLRKWLKCSTPHIKLKVEPTPLKEFAWRCPTRNLNSNQEEVLPQN